MDEQAKMSRAAFLGILGSGVAALVVGRLVGMIESTSRVSFLKNVDQAGYGKSAYGGKKA